MIVVIEPSTYLPAAVISPRIIAITQNQANMQKFLGNDWKSSNLNEGDVIHLTNEVLIKIEQQDPAIHSIKIGRFRRRFDLVTERCIGNST
jgi:hypothetical protein